MITNIIIDYANEDEVINYAKQIKEQSCLVKLICVINKEGKRGINYLTNELDKIGLQYSIVDPKKNLGYINGMVYGFKNDDKKSDWYILSNTDIAIDDTSMIEKFLMSPSANDSSYWLIGPSVYAPIQGKYSNPYYSNRPSLRYYKMRIYAMRLYHLFHLVFSLRSMINKKKRKPRQESCDVYAIHGSYMFLRRELLEKICGEAEWELLYDEEQFIAEVVRKNGKKVYYNADIEVQHMEGSSTGKIDLKGKYLLMIKANERLINEYY